MAIKLIYYIKHRECEALYLTAAKCTVQDALTAAKCIY